MTSVRRKVRAGNRNEDGWQRASKQSACGCPEHFVAAPMTSIFAVRNSGSLRHKWRDQKGASQCRYWAEGSWYESKVIRVGPAGWAYKDWRGIVYPHAGRADVFLRKGSIARRKAGLRNWEPKIGQQALEISFFEGLPAVHRGTTALTGNPSPSGSSKKKSLLTGAR